MITEINVFGPHGGAVWDFQHPLHYALPMLLAGVIEEFLCPLVGSSTEYEGNTIFTISSPARARGPDGVPVEYDLLSEAVM